MLVAHSLVVRTPCALNVFGATRSSVTPGTTALRSLREIGKHRQKHCAGALIFALKTERGLPQLARIALRLGMLRLDRLFPYYGMVFDSVKEMQASSWPDSPQVPQESCIDRS